MSYKLSFTKTALQDIEKHKKSGDKSILLKIYKILNELRQHPKYGTGKPEILKHGFQGLYSRRIYKNHRIIYSVKDEIVTVVVLSAYAHYDDKQMVPNVDGKTEQCVSSNFLTMYKADLVYFWNNGSTSGWWQSVFPNEIITDANDLLVLLNGSTYPSSWLDFIKVK